MYVEISISKAFYSIFQQKNIEVKAKGVVVLGRELITNTSFPITFQKRIWIENLETSQEVLKIMELEDKFSEAVQREFINIFLKKIEENLVKAI